MEICSSKFEFWKKYSELLRWVRLVLRDKDLVINDCGNSFEQRRGLTFKEISSRLKQIGIVFEDKELYYVLNFLLSNEQEIVRDDYWHKDTEYRLLDKYLFCSSVQRSYYSFTDDRISPKVFLLKADEHIGSDIFNPKLSHNLCDYVIKNGATICFNLGDLFEGLPGLSGDKYKYGASQQILSNNEEEFYRQLEIFKNEYPKPFPNEMRTYALMGNHDETINRFLKYQSSIISCDLRKLSIYNPSFYMFPRTKWCTALNGIDFHFNHRLYMNALIDNLKITEFNDIEKKEELIGDLILANYYNIFISGHMHKAFVYSNPDCYKERTNLYLSVPSTSNINVGGVVGYLIYMYPESNSMEVSILGCDNNLNIFEKDRFSWEFNKINNKCHKHFR